MSKQHQSTSLTGEVCSSTKRALLLNSLLNEPLIVVLGLVAAMLVKELQASPLEISLFTMTRPVMSLFSFYLASFFLERGTSLKKQLLVTGLLSRLPFLFFPWLDQPWQIILCTGLYMTLSFTGLPAWIEVLKIKLPNEHRSRLFSSSAVGAYIEGLGLAIILGNLLNHVQGSWRLIFPVCALVGLLSLFWQAQIPLRPKAITALEGSDFSSRLIRPWKKTFKLLMESPDFLRFQIGFMSCGAAIMLVYAVMPHYFVNHLKVGYKDIAIATAFFKALGYALTSSSWAKYLQRFSLFKVSSLIFLILVLFPLALIAASYDKRLLYVAYIIYGVGLAGNHLVWHMSPAFFSGKKDSSIYSTVNVLMVGVRGMIFPLLGAWMGQVLGIQPVLALSSLMCLLAAVFMHLCARGYGSSLMSQK